MDGTSNMKEVSGMSLEERCNKLVQCNEIESMITNGMQASQFLKDISHWLHIDEEQEFDQREPDIDEMAGALSEDADLRKEVLVFLKETHRDFSIRESEELCLEEMKNWLAEDLDLRIQVHTLIQQKYQKSH